MRATDPPDTCYTSSVILGLGVSPMRRRDLITLLGGAAAWPLAARAQQPGKTRRVGYIRAGAPRNDPFREEFVRGMRDLGYVEGRNIANEFRHYGDDVDSIPSLIGELLRAKIDIIVVGAPLRSAPRRAQRRASLSSWERRPTRWAPAWSQVWRTRGAT